MLPFLNYGFSLKIIDILNFSEDEKVSNKKIIKFLAANWSLIAHFFCPRVRFFFLLDYFSYLIEEDLMCQ